MNRLLATALLGAFTLAALPARADVTADAEAVFAARSVADRDAALARLAGSDDPTALYATGTARFFTALEGLGRGFHRHGFESPESFLLPLTRLPVPPNPTPQPLDYEGFRTILAEFRTGLAEAASMLGRVPAEAQIGVVVDLLALGIDIDGDGTIAPHESAGAIMASLGGGMPDPTAPAATAFRFDRADGYWLQGYSNVLMAQVDFWLAHDFKTAFDSSFHMVFPRAGLPMQDYLVPEGQPTDMVAAEWRIADFITFVHYINWPVVEPDRRRAARAELLEVVRLSRENWKSIAAETDNDREWLPGPHQRGPNALTGLEVEQAQVDAWHATLAMTEDLLEGRRLLPHFRITGKGIDMKRFFEEPGPFDLVAMITGPAVVPYLAQGDILTSDEFAAIRAQFGGAGFMTFALWFN